MAARFSKQTLTRYIQERIAGIQNEWGFDPDNGYSQVNAIADDRLRTNPLEALKNAAPPQRDAMTREAAHRDYGDFDRLRRMADEFDLDVRLIPEDHVLVMTKTNPRFKRFRLRKDVQ